MSKFDKQVEEQQVTWRNQHVDCEEMGVQNGKRRPWILPEQLWAEGLWSGIQKDLPQYLQREKVQRHEGCHNLKSSWMLCANLYFPFREDLPLLASFLKEYVDARVDTVDRIELEYAEEGDLCPSCLLGEPEGSRGSNQTSPDIAFLVNGSTGLILTENKYTEHSFYECSGRKLRPNPDRCLDLNRILTAPQDTCYQLQWKNDSRTNRKYWDYLSISDYGRSTLKCCPAANGGCQLFRQQALAEGIAQSGKYEFVVSCVAYDDRNDTLVNSLKGTGLDHFADWGRLFDGKAQFATFTHHQWVQWVKEHHSGRWTEWLEYVKQRYEY